METTKKWGGISLQERTSSAPMMHTVQAVRTDFELNVLVPRLRQVCYFITAVLLGMYLAMVVDTTIGTVHPEFPKFYYVPNFSYRHNLVSCILSYISLATCLLYLIGLCKRLTNCMWEYILVHIILLFDLVVQMFEAIIETANGKYSLSASICSCIMVVTGSIILYYMFLYYQFLRNPEDTRLYAT